MFLVFSGLEICFLILVGLESTGAQMRPFVVKAHVLFSAVIFSKVTAIPCKVGRPAVGCCLDAPGATETQESSPLFAPWANNSSTYSENNIVLSSQTVLWHDSSMIILDE